MSLTRTRSQGGIDPFLSEGLRRRTPTSKVTGESDARKSPPASDLLLGEPSEGWTSAFRSLYRAGEAGPSGITTWDMALAVAATFKDIGELYQKIDKVGKGPPGLYFCNTCAAWRKRFWYLMSIEDLLIDDKPCEYCWRKHLRVNFSYSERDRFPLGRRCVLHEGAWRVCAHLELEWSDIKNRDWSERPRYRRTRDGWTVTVSCKHPDHHVNERPAVTITFRRGERKVPDGYVLSSNQNLFPRIDAPEKQVESCLAKVFDTLKAGGTMLCPHLRITPETLRSIASHPHSSVDGTNYTYVCQFCRFIVRFHLSDRQQPRIECRQDVRMDTNGGVGTWSSFMLLIDPESFNLRSDGRTRCVLWCDDKQCATSFEYASWVAATTTVQMVREDNKSECWALLQKTELARALDVARSILIETGKYHRGEIEGTEWNSGGGERSRI
jgi:hypothetical protein